MMTSKTTRSAARSSNNVNKLQHTAYTRGFLRNNVDIVILTQIFCSMVLCINTQLCSSWVTTTRIRHSTTLQQQIVQQQQQKQSRTTNTAIFGSVTNKFNIVLEPTVDNPIAFDSFKIGSAKVHRYTSTGNTISTRDDDGTEYVMWYHGRSIELHESDNGQKLPPLSTGRIGRATSRNGLVWKKQTIGSASEDRHDVSLGLNIESWWGFDTTHVGLGTVLLPMTTPAVMTDGGVYLLYYMGGNGEEITMDDYLGTTSTTGSSRKIQGMNMKIGVALSQDGISFGRVEGDDPSGAVVVPTNDELYCGWPEVIVKIPSDDQITKNAKNPDDTYIMYYSTMLKSTKQKCIAYATSVDGFRWIKQQVCIEPSTTIIGTNDNNNSVSHNDAGGVARCCVTQDAVYNKGTWLSIPDAYTMYYEGVSSTDNKHRIMKATSIDGKIWTKVGVALDIGSSSTDTDTSWDCNGVGSPNIVRLDDGSSRMYYTGQGLDGSTAIGVAKDVDGSGTWVREQATITFQNI